MKYVAVSFAQPVWVEEGGFVRVGRMYVLYSSKPRFKARLQKDLVVKEVEFEGMQADVEEFVWDLRLRAAEVALEGERQEDPVERAVEELRRRVAEEGCVEAPAYTREELDIALKAAEGYEAVYDAVSGKLKICLSGSSPIRSAPNRLKSRWALRASARP